MFWWLTNCVQVTIYMNKQDWRFKNQVLTDLEEEMKKLTTQYRRNLSENQFLYTKLVTVKMKMFHLYFKILTFLLSLIQFHLGILDFDILRSVKIWKSCGRISVFPLHLLHECLLRNFIKLRYHEIVVCQVLVIYR